MFVSIKKILSPISERISFGGGVEIYSIKKAWPQIREIFLKGKEGKIEPLHFKKGTLTISCPNSVWANELKLRQNNIIKKLNEALKENKVERLKYVY